MRAWAGGLGAALSGGRGAQPCVRLVGVRCDAARTAGASGRFTSSSGQSRPPVSRAAAADACPPRAVHGAAEDASVDASEVRKFNESAAHWWSTNGPASALHRMNPVRVAFIRAAASGHFQLARENALRGLRVLDVGCGGGLVSEPLARLGANVLGIDAAEVGVKVARQHAQQDSLLASNEGSAEFRSCTAEALVAEAQAGKLELFEIVSALEIIEHVADVQAFLRSLASLVKPGGLLILSTINRTAQSYLVAILGAEYITRMVPQGTHSFSRFIQPPELAAAVEKAGLSTEQVAGAVFNPVTHTFALSQDTSVNYFLVASKPESATEQEQDV
mmetsp:Transcript_929/g.2554  ORF Transcript_929/g.2554 Transcript_929/m.2554 type:complete len:333 (-) Transcript_929:775-1773(-)